MDAERTVGYPALRFEASGRTVDATVFPIDGIRQSPYSPWTAADEARRRTRGAELIERVRPPGSRQP